MLCLNHRSQVEPPFQPAGLRDELLTCAALNFRQTAGCCNLYIATSRRIKLVLHITGSRLPTDRYGSDRVASGGRNPPCRIQSVIRRVRPRRTRVWTQTPPLSQITADPSCCFQAGFGPASISTAGCHRLRATSAGLRLEPPCFEPPLRRSSACSAKPPPRAAGWPCRTSPPLSLASGWSCYLQWSSIRVAFAFLIRPFLGLRVSRPCLRVNYTGLVPTPRRPGPASLVLSRRAQPPLHVRTSSASLRACCRSEPAQVLLHIAPVPRRADCSPPLPRRVAASAPPRKDRPDLPSPEPFRSRCLSAACKSSSCYSEKIMPIDQTVKQQGGTIWRVWAWT